MPGKDTIIGRVAVKVFPDTSEFRRNTQRKLEAIEKSLEVKVQVVPDLDSEAVAREVAALRERLEQQLASIDIGFDVDGARAKDSVDRLHESLEDELDNIEIRPRFDQQVLQSLRAQATRLRERFEALLDAKIKPHFSEDTEVGLKAQATRLRQRLQALLRPDVKPELSQSKAGLVAARLAALTRDRVVNVGIEIRKRSLAGLATFTLAMAGLRGFNEIFGGVFRSLLRLDIIAPIFATIALAAAGLSIGLVSLTGNLLSLGASIASIAPLALALPGLLIAAGIGVGAFVAALKDFNTIFPDVKAKFGELQDMISERFWREAQRPVRQFIDSVFPQLERGFAKVATAAGGFFGNFARDLRRVFTQRLDGWFNSVAEAFTRLSRYTIAFSQIVGVLGTLGTKLMPRLADATGRVATRFAIWLTEGEKTGRLNELIENAIQAVKDLGRALGALGSIFAGLSRAATKAGGSTLRTFADTLSDVARVVNSQRFQIGMTKTFSAAYDAMERIRREAGPGLVRFFSQLGQVIEDIGPKVGNSIGIALGAIADTLASPYIRRGINDLFDSIDQAVRKIAPELDKLAPAIGSLLTLIGDLARLVGDSVAQALQYVGPMIDNLAQGIRPLTDALNEIVRDIVDAIGPGLVDLSKEIRGLFETAAEKVDNLWSAMSPFVQQGVRETLKGVVDVFRAIKENLGKIKPETLEILGRFVGKLIELAGTVIGATLTSIAVGLGAIGDKANDIAAPGGTLDNLGKDGGTLDKAIAKFKEFNDELNKDIGDGKAFDNSNGFTDWLADLGEQLYVTRIIWQQWMKTMFADLGDFAGKFLAGSTALMSNVAGAFSSGYARLSSITSATFSILGGIAKRGWDAMLNFAKQSFVATVTAVQSGVGSVVSKVAELPGRLVAATVAFGSTLVSRGRDLLTGLLSGSVQGAVSVAVFFAGLPDRILGWLGDVASKLFAAGVAVIQGFINGIKSAIGGIASTLAGITAMLPSWKGPPETDKTILVAAGRMVIDGFIAGLESRYDAVRKSLAGLTADVAGTSMLAPEIAVAGGSRALRAALSVDGATANADQRQFNYYAAPNNSLDAEEDLFAATDRARFAFGKR